MTLAEHLYELRARLARALAAVGLAAVVTFVLFHPIFAALTHPYCRLPVSRRLGGAGCDLIVTAPLEGFMVRLHVALFAALILSAPVWLYQLWAFITPGLYRAERRYALSFVAASCALFLLGAATAYVSMSKALGFLLTVAGSNVTPLITVNNYLSFFTNFVVVFGVAFEFPLLVVMLNLAGVVGYPKLRSWRRMEIFLVTAFAAVATPSQDPITMLALAVPMWLLYELALLVARWHDARAARRARESPYAALADDELSPIDDPDQPAAHR